MAQGTFIRATSIPFLVINEKSEGYDWELRIEQAWWYKTKTNQEVMFKSCVADLVPSLLG